MTKDVRTLKIEQGLACSLHAARIEYEVARSQLAIDYHAARRKLVADAKAYAASFGIDTAAIGVPVDDNTKTMEGCTNEQ